MMHYAVVPCRFLRATGVKYGPFSYLEIQYPYGSAQIVSTLISVVAVDYGVQPYPIQSRRRRAIEKYGQDRGLFKG
jgi:hypothetical protein